MIKRYGRKTLRFARKVRDSFREEFLLENRLAYLPCHTSGTIKLDDWSISYIDSCALRSMWDLQFGQRYNDFFSSTEHPKILDCGSNIGISVLRYKHLYPESHIVAFEPDPVICEVLRENVKANSLTNVDVIQAAVWTENTSVNFSVSPTGDSQAGHLATLDSDAIPRETITVKSIWLGEYLNEPVDFLKLDIEGAELPVLLSCVEQLKNVNQMMVEVHYRVDQSETLVQILNILKQQGFSVAMYQLFGPPTYKPFTRDETSVADQFPVLWAWRS